MESIVLACLLLLSVPIMVREQRGPEDHSKRADVLGYPHASSPLLVSVYSCISSASLRPRLGVSYRITQVTHLDAACCAGKEEMLLLCNLKIAHEKKTSSGTVAVKYWLVWLFLHMLPPPFPWRPMDYLYSYLLLHLYNYSVGVGLVLSFMEFDLFDWFFSHCLPSQWWGSICNTYQHVYCIYMHSSTSKTWLRTYFLLLFNVSFLFVSSGPQIWWYRIISFKWAMR